MFMENLFLIMFGFFGSFVVGLFMVVGVVFVLFGCILFWVMCDLLFGFVVGVMLLVLFFLLIILVLDVVELMFENGVMFVVIVCVLIFLGMGVVVLMNEKLLYEYFKMGCEGFEVVLLWWVWLFIIVIMIYNFFEGFVVGVGFGFGGMEGGFLFVIGIGL